MKKLMIAAVAVAAATVASAVDYEAYDFTATVKTTKGKVGKAITETLNLGKNGNTFWYDDNAGATVAALRQCGLITTKQIAGREIPALVKVNGIIAASTNTTVMTDANVAACLRYLANTYSEKSAGQWCETVKLRNTIPCYRVAGSEKISCTLYVTNCCYDADNDAFLAMETDNNGNLVTNGLVTIDNTYGVFQRFGAQTRDRANKVEVYGGVGFGTSAFGPGARTFARNFNGQFAGQGSWNVADGCIASVSGNIVGIMDAPVCEYCCSAPDTSIAFDCNGAGNVGRYAWTAGFGSFRIKRNARKDFAR